MKNLQILKVGVFLTLLLFFIPTLNASTNKYILNDDGLIDQRASGKIYEIGNELEIKTGVNVYIHLQNSYRIDEKLPMKEKFEIIRTYEKNIIKQLQAPYVIVLMELELPHMNLVTSDDLKNIVDEDDILDNYIIPVVASKDKNQLLSKVSAALLNGYAQVGDDIATSRNIKLESSIGSDGTTFSAFWKVFMYFIIITGLAAYTIAVLKAKKK